MTTKPTLAIVIPTYGQFDYAERAVRSAIKNTHYFKPSIIVYDDCSPDEKACDAFGGFVLACQIEYGVGTTMTRFHTNGGLTRSWNAGLADAKKHKDEYCCVTNSDVIFSYGWDKHIADALEKYALVGPVTNAPGCTDRQYIGRYSLCYDKKKGDDLTHIDVVQYEMHNNNKHIECSINGFCMVAKTQTWWDNAFDAEHVFCPINPVNFSGRANPTPLMTLNEDELQRRWRDRGLKAAACCGSYVFHYRAVTRGNNHLKGDWTRKKEAPK